MSGDFGTGKTILVLAIVVGCFGVLWPKIFYPMLTASVKQPSSPPTRQDTLNPHARPERPAHLYPEMMHPALREKGRALPQRTIDKQARPGPMPGVRPPMGGAGGIVPPPAGKGSGAMGIIMPLYTVGIVIFFVYTIMKVLFKKGPDDDKTPKLKDFGLDPEYRKYVFAEEYLDNSDMSTRDQMRRQVREESRARRKAQHEHQPETKIGGSRTFPCEGKMDTQGKKLGKSECDKKDEQLDQLRRRLEETEKAMERLMCQMGSVTDKLTAAKITEVLSQAQAQAKILKEEVSEMTSEDDVTSSEALTTTMSDDTSLPTSLQRHLQELQVEQLSSISELVVDGVLDEGQVKKLLEKEKVQVDGSTTEEESLEADEDEEEEASSQEIKVGTAQPPVDTTSPQEASVDVLKDLKTEVAPEAAAGSTQAKEEETLVTNEDVPAAVTSPAEETLDDQKAVAPEGIGISSELPVPAESTQPPAPAESTQPPAPAESLQPQILKGDVPKENLEAQEGDLKENLDEPKIGQPLVTTAPGSTTCIMTFTTDIQDIAKETLAEREDSPSNHARIDKPEAQQDLAQKEAKVQSPTDAPQPIARELSGEAGGEEGSSEATETGADISDLHSFAEEEQSPQKSTTTKEKQISLEDQENQVTAAVGTAEDTSEAECKGQGTQTSFALTLPTPVAVSTEHSTQTDKEQGVTVVGLHTSFRHDEGGVETKAATDGLEKSGKVTEIVLDALLPSETQLLVKDSHSVGSRPTQDLEIDASEAGSVPCVVTSHVSLAFLGLEQRDESAASGSDTLVKAGGTEVTTIGVGEMVQPASLVPKVEASPVSAPDLVLPSSDSPQDGAGLQSPKEMTLAAVDTPQMQPQVSSVSLAESDVKKSAEQQLLPRPSSPVPPRIPDEEEVTQKPTQTKEISSAISPSVDSLPGKEEKMQDDAALQQAKSTEETSSGTVARPVSPSLEAIAEAVASATTKAALDLLTASSTDTVSSPQELQTSASQTSVMTETPQNQSPISTDESSTATTVVALSETEDLGPSESQAVSATETLAPEISSQSAVYVATVTHTPSGSPSSTPEEDIAQETVEAALAEAAQEEILNNANTGSPASQVVPSKESSTTAAVSPVRKMRHQCG